MTMSVNGAPVPPEIEAAGDEAIQQWYDTEGKRHPDHREPDAKPVEPVTEKETER